MCISHVHECISVDHVYSVQNECTVTAVLCLSLLAEQHYVQAQDEWVLQMEHYNAGLATALAWHSCFQMDQLESEASKDPCRHTFVLVFMYINP